MAAELNGSVRRSGSIEYNPLGHAREIGRAKPVAPAIIPTDCRTPLQAPQELGT